MRRATDRQRPHKSTSRSSARASGRNAARLRFSRRAGAGGVPFQCSREEPGRRNRGTPRGKRVRVSDLTAGGKTRGIYTKDNIYRAVSRARADRSGLLAGRPGPGGLKNVPRLIYAATRKLRIHKHLPSPDCSGVSRFRAAWSAVGSRENARIPSDGPPSSRFMEEFHSSVYLAGCRGGAAASSPFEPARKENIGDPRAGPEPSNRPRNGEGRS